MKRYISKKIKCSINIESTVMRLKCNNYKEHIGFFSQKTLRQITAEKSRCKEKFKMAEFHLAAPESLLHSLVHYSLYDSHTIFK